MEKEQAAFGKESHKWDCNDLKKVVGEGKALEKVALYSRKAYSRYPLIREGALMQSFLNQASAEDLKVLESVTVSFTPPAPPELEEEDYYDPTDKGLTPVEWLIQTKRVNSKGQKARRVKRNG